MWAFKSYSPISVHTLIKICYLFGWYSLEDHEKLNLPCGHDVIAVLCLVMRGST